jgi:folate-binding protein YgfZ
MSGKRFAALSGRSVIAISGEDAESFLQGVISNDITKATESNAIYAALLTPQGKFLHDFFITRQAGRLLMDVEAERKADLIRRLTMYKLRAKVEITDEGDGLAVFALFGDGAPEALGLTAPGQAKPLGGGVVYGDPRVAALGARAMLPVGEADTALKETGFQAADAEAYHRQRLALGVPDGSHDIPAEKAFLLESNFEDLHGIDFDKGCYVGQELTARTKHRGTVRKRLFRVDIDGPLPDPGTPVMLGEKEAGTMRSGLDGTGIALLRLEVVEAAAGSGAPLVAGDARLTPVKPDWASF